MESHEWTDRADEGKVFCRANCYLGKGWTIMTSTQRRNQPPFPRPPVRPDGGFRSLPQTANS